MKVNKVCVRVCVQMRYLVVYIAPVQVPFIFFYVVYDILRTTEEISKRKLPVRFLQSSCFFPSQPTATASIYSRRSRLTRATQLSDQYGYTNITSEFPAAHEVYDRWLRWRCYPGRRR